MVFFFCVNHDDICTHFDYVNHLLVFITFYYKVAFCSKGKPQVGWFDVLKVEFYEIIEWDDDNNKWQDQLKLNEMYCKQNWLFFKILLRTATFFSSNFFPEKLRQFFIFICSSSLSLFRNQAGLPVMGWNVGSVNGVFNVNQQYQNLPG